MMVDDVLPLPGGDLVGVTLVGALPPSRPVSVVPTGVSVGFWVVVLGEAVEVDFSAGFWVVVLGEAVEVGFSAGFWAGALGEVVLDFGNWSI